MTGILTTQCAQDNVFVELDGAIKIDSIFPSSGVVGTKVRVFGKGFSSVLKNNEISINGVKASVLEPASLSALLIEVPANAKTGIVSLKVGNILTQGPVFTVVDPPVIQSITPTEGFAGYRISIIGSKLAQVTTALFNGVTGQIFSKTETEIIAIAPSSTTGSIELLFPEGKVAGPIFTYLPIPVIDTAAVVRVNRVEDVIAMVGRNFSTDALSLKVYLNGLEVAIHTVTVAADGRPIVAIYMPPADINNPVSLVVEADGIKSLPFEFVIPPVASDLSYARIGNSLRISLEVYGSYFGAQTEGKEVQVFQVTNGSPSVPVTIISWTPRLITVEMDIQLDQYYDLTVVVNGKSSNILRFRP